MKNLIQKILSRYERRIERIGNGPDTTYTSQLISRHLLPSLVMDIGVAEGTPWLYEQWPNAEFLLFDPTHESRPHMEAIAKRCNATIHNIALGERECYLTIKVRPDIAGATFFDEIGEAEIVAEYEVPVRRVDSIVPEIKQPCLVKIDVQGAELDVLKGFGETLKQVDVFDVETALISTIHGASEFAAIVEFFGSNGFCLYDIVGFIRRPLDGALAYVDAVFVPESSLLRENKRWA